jgi:hypothetical protein
MFGSARDFLSAACTFSLLACSLETPGGREPRGEPWPVTTDAQAQPDAASVVSGADAAAQDARDSDGGPSLTPEAGDDADAPAPDAASDAGAQPGDATAPVADAARDASSVDVDAAEAGSTPAEAGLDAAAPDAASACDLEGSFGVDVQFDVSWNGTTLAGIVPLLKPGTGKMQMLARIDLRGGALRSRALVTACGTQLPDFTAGNWLVGNENYAGFIPHEAWDSPSMPRWDLGWDVGCDQPGCSIETELLDAVIGARSGARDVWPGRKGPLSAVVPVDHDEDGEPAVTMSSRDSDERNPDGVPYRLIPVTWTLLTRSPRAFIPFRVTGEFHGKLDTCDAFSGVVSNGSVEARCVGCVARNEGQPRERECSDQEVVFLDENLPDWSVSGGTWRARRVPDDASCSAVRAAMR